MSITKVSDYPCFSSGCEGAENKANDLIGYGKDGEEHRSLFAVLDGLCQVGITLNGVNCGFGLTELMFFGHKLSSNGEYRRYHRRKTSGLLERSAIVYADGVEL